MPEPEVCRHCGAEVHYECNGASRCKACGEKLYGIVLPSHSNLEFSIMPAIVVFDQSVAEMMNRVGD